MVEIKNNALIIDGETKNLNNINIINGKNNFVYFSNNMLERIKNYPYPIEEIYALIKKAGLNNFWFVNNKIININNIQKVYIKYYQYAGLSIIESLRINAETCVVNIECVNGRTESISFSSDKEAEKFYHELDNRIIESKCTEGIKV